MASSIVVVVLAESVVVVARLTACFLLLLLRACGWGVYINRLVADFLAAKNNASSDRHALLNPHALLANQVNSPGGLSRVGAGCCVGGRGGGRTTDRETPRH